MDVSVHPPVIEGHFCFAEYTRIHICRYHPNLQDPVLERLSKETGKPKKDIDLFDHLGLEKKIVEQVDGLGTIALIHSTLAHSIKFVHFQACLPGKPTL